MIFNLLDSMWPQTHTPTPTELVLYNAGNECSNVTGGWSTFAPAWAGNAYTNLTESGGEVVYGANPISGTGVKESGDLKIYFRNPDRSSQWVNTAFGTVSRVNLTGWNTLHVRATVSEHSVNPVVVSSYCVFGATQSKTPPTDGTHTPPGNYKNLAVGDNTLDISGLTGNQYVYFGGELNTGAHGLDSARHVHIVVTKIWLT